MFFVCSLYEFVCWFVVIVVRRSLLFVVCISLLGVRRFLVGGVGCFLFVVCCSLCVVRCLMFVVCLCFNRRCASLVVACWLLVVLCS